MSNSLRAKERRSKRSRLSKHERSTIASQHSGDAMALSSTIAVPKPMSAARKAFQ